MPSKKAQSMDKDTGVFIGNMIMKSGYIIGWKYWRIPILNSIF
jgi:hypothetical protein